MGTALPQTPSARAAHRLCFWQRCCLRAVPWTRTSFPQVGACGGSGQALPLCEPAADALAACATQSLPAVRLAFVLSALEHSAAQALLVQALRVAEEVWLADFKLVERNLEWPAYWAVRAVPWLWPCLAYGRAVAGFMHHGGLEGLLQRCAVSLKGQGAGLNVLERQRLWGGAAVLLRVRGTLS